MSTSLTVDVFLEATKNENDWSTLGIFLKVPQSELKAIEEEKSTVLHRKTELFLRWSKISKPNWSDLISALRKMQNISLADALTEKYLKSPVSVQTSLLTTLPISPLTMASSLSPPPTTVPLSVDTIMLPQTSALSLSPPHSGSETGEDIFMDTLQQTEEKPGYYHILLDEGIAREFSRLDAKLIRMVSKIKSALREKNVSIEELQDFITDYRTIDPIPPEFATITNVVTKKRLNYSCNNCDILQHVVSNFLDGTRLKTDIAQFIEEVEKFKSSTSIKSLLQVVLKVANKVSGYVIIKVEKYWGDATIKQFEKMVKSLFRKYFKYLTQMQVTEGCYCISYTVHKHYAACLHTDLPTNAFLTLIGIISIYIDGTIYFQRETKGSLTLDSALCNAIESHDVYAVELLLAVGASTIIPYKSGTPVIDIVKDMSGVCLMTVLHVASANNHIDVASSLIEAGCDRNKQNSFGWTALMLAVKEGATGVMKHLLKVGANPNIQSNDGYTALHIASEMSEIDFISLLLSYSANKHTIDRRAWNALMVASHENNAAAVTLLLNAGSFSNIRAKDGATALHLACRNLSPDAVCTLLAHKNTIPDMYDRFRWTPLMTTSASGSIWFVKKLLEAAVDLNFQNCSGATALYIACQCSHTDVVRTLLVHKADPNIVLTDGWSPLMIASQTGNNEIVNSLLIANADVNHQCHSGLTALMLAVGTSHATIVSCLLNYGGDPNRADDRKWTALMIASLKGNVDISNQLLAAKAKQNIENDYGDTALHIACYSDHPEIASTLLEKQNYKKQTGNTALMLAVKRHDDSAVSMLLTNGANPDMPDSDGFTPLMVACKSGNNALVSQLLNKGAEPNVSSPNHQSALDIACYDANYNMMDLLLEHNADPYFQDNNPLMIVLNKKDATGLQILLNSKYGIDPNLILPSGQTLLHFAAENNWVEVISQLLANGANCDVCGNEGNTPLIIATKNCEMSSVEILLRNGADPNIKDQNGDTAIHFASSSEIAKLLLTHKAQPNVIDIMGYTPLQRACESGFYSIAIELLHSKADPNTAEGKFSRTPIYITAEKGYLMILTDLLNFGGNPNICLKSNEWTPLMIASVKGYIHIVNILLVNEAHPNHQAIGGITALHLATKRGFTSIVESLLNAGASPTIVDSNKETPIDIARNEKKMAILQLLMDSNEEELYDSVSLISDADSSYSSFYDDEDRFTLVSVTTTDSITTVDSGNTPDHPD